MRGYIPPGSKVMTPDGRMATVVRYIPWLDGEKAICRFPGCPLEPAVAYAPRQLKIAKV